uniref:C2H2-type domain-containing protein n=1 Tax=Glossina pallidipes TaxID=7398 RepID=A0A1A9ZKY4_GLOPL
MVNSICEFCGKTYKRKCSLNRHLRMQHEFNCLSCELDPFYAHSLVIRLDSLYTCSKFCCGSCTSWRDPPAKKTQAGSSPKAQAALSSPANPQILKQFPGSILDLRCRLHCCSTQSTGR